MQVHEEENIVKLGEVSGIGIKKARQVKQAIAVHLEELARSAILPDVVDETETTEEPGQTAPDAENGPDAAGEPNE